MMIAGSGGTGARKLSLMVLVRERCSFPLKAVALWRLVDTPSLGKLGELAFVRKSWPLGHGHGRDDPFLEQYGRAEPVGKGLRKSGKLRNLSYNPVPNSGL